MDSIEVDSGDKAIIILQSLICYLREKNVLTRADIEELRERVDSRLSAAEKSMPCDVAAATAAAHEKWPASNSSAASGTAESTARATDTGTPRGLVRKADGLIEQIALSDSLQGGDDHARAQIRHARRIQA